MQNPEEDILKRLLQDTFSDYEPEPSEQTWENIRFAIQPDEPRFGGNLKRFIFPVVALLLLLSSVVIWHKTDDEIANPTVKNTENLAINNRKEIKENENITHEFKSKEKREVVERELVTKRFESVKGSEVYTPNKLLVDSVTPKEEEEKLLNARQQSEAIVVLDKTSENVSIPNEKVSTQSLLVSLNEKVALTESKNDELGIIDLENSTEKQFFATGKLTKKQKKTSNIGYNLQEKSIANLGDEDRIITENHSAINDAVIEQVRYIKPLDVLESKDLVLEKVNFTTPKISSISINKEVKPIRRATYLSVSITPLQTYRILTVNNRGVQNLLKNSLFDAERNGFAFEVGMTKAIANTWNFRSNISYLKMRQWAEYQVSTDEILVKNTSAITNSIEQIGERKTERQTLEMVGLKVDVQKFLRTSIRNRYFIATGTQLMYDPANRQSNVFVNASAGFQHIINKNCFLTVEPTANYLLNNINDSKSLIQSSAYNLGLKIGLNFKVQ
ncbi:hypothetical protein LV89_01155 [Arcicella aurantiaca]|uniref:Uncharacterized protein n=1 Tax=Arcicella aurantiaca TaxID=591202 RepID=A0A316ED14_9BACT|nr:hypothetical protein [Arcicella aurantiaca]PWK28371.1 hypothetical protein LV89_01155 [Arcicella aurantiaca]